ncbi:MAG: site-specific integrase [Chitinophagaceae bacterium]
MSVTLRKRKNSDGSTSLLLDIYHNGKRTYEFLKDLKLYKPANLADRQANKDKLDQALKIETKRALELSVSDYSMITDTGKKTEIAVWMEHYVDGYKKKDKRNMVGVFKKFKNFLSEDKKTGLTFGKLNELIISDFQDYLRQHSKGEGASSYFSRFKKMIKQAYRQKLISINPAAEVKTIQGNSKKKDTLTLAEIQTLFATPIESNEVKKAFIFSCVTGLRWIDVSRLQWKHINIHNRYMDVQQTKTNRSVRISLNNTALALLEKEGMPDDLAFQLPTPNGANKTLKAWVKRSGIKKTITWHNARHSFGTNLVFFGADISTASNLLGHSSLKHTHRYVKAANELKEKATDTLNIDL